MNYRYKILLIIIVVVIIVFSYVIYEFSTIATSEVYTKKSDIVDTLFDNKEILDDFIEILIFKDFKGWIIYDSGLDRYMFSSDIQLNDDEKRKLDVITKKLKFNTINRIDDCYYIYRNVPKIYGDIYIGLKYSIKDSSKTKNHIVGKWYYYYSHPTVGRCTHKKIFYWLYDYIYNGKLF